MTRINKLTQNPELFENDLFVIWDNDNQRTRSITAEALNKYTDANGANAQAFVNGYIRDGILYMVRANDEAVNIGSVTGVELLAEGSIPKVENGKLVASAVKETDNAVVFTKDIIAPQESVFVGPAVKISDKGGYLGVDNLADDRESTPVVSFVYETEAERDAIFSDGVSVPKYRYFVPAKWVYQFPFEAEYSNANKLSFEFQDTDNTLIRKFRMFSQKAQSGVRIWIENLLPSGDALVWENVSEDSFNEGNGQAFVPQGENDQFTLVESGLVKISTANIRFRFNVQAQPGEILELQGQEIDLGFGTGFYPRMVTYTQDEKDLDLLDSIETSQNRFGQFGEQFRIETSDIVARDLGDQAEAIPQGIFDTAITSDRPEATYVNGDKPIQINAITVKHIGTWSPVQVSLNDDRTQVVDLVDGDNTITFTKPLTVEANQSVYFRFTGAVGTGSQTQISLLGDAQQEIYYKLDITELEEKTVTVNGVESVVAGNKITVDNSDPKNPIVNWDPSGDLLPGVNVNKDGAQVLSAADTLNFSSSFDVAKAKDTGGTVNIELSQTARGTNEVGVFESTTDLLAAYPTPENGLYARVLQDNNNLPDDRYESKGGSWIGMGGVAGQVIVDANKSLGLIMGDGLKSEDDGGKAKISLDGNTPVLTFDVTVDSTRSVDTSYVGKLINIIQTPPSISLPMQITLVDHSQFKTGDTIKIAADRDGDDAYNNYYFAVYFNDSKGRQIAKYPANNITMVRTDTAWDVQLDGRYTNVSIRPKAAFNIPYAPDEQYNTPVNAFVFAESPAVEFEVDEDTNTRIVKLELDKATPEDPTFKTVNIDTFGSGQPNFTAAIKQDGDLHTIIDATREFRVQHKDIGTGLLTSVFGIDNNQAQFLVQPYYANSKLATESQLGNYIQKHTNAEINKLFVAYQGKYGDNRAFYPVSLYQDVNGWTQFEFTANMQFKSKNKDSGSVGDKVLEVKSAKVVAHKDFEVLGNTIYNGDTSQPTNLINRQALDDEPQKEWFSVANGTLATDGSRPTGDSGVEGELAVWHNVTSDSTTDPANELKILFDGAYEKVDDFSKPLRFLLSQQSGARKQYWTVQDNGWQTEGNVWHLSASKVTGDNLIVGIDTTVQASALFLADVSDEIDEKIAADKAKGEWIGGVYKDTINDDGNPGDEFTCENPKHWLEYRKTTFQGDYALIVKQGDTPISSEIVIHLHPSSGMNSTQFQVVTNDGKTSTKTIRLNEKWRFFLRKGTWPYYERIDDGASGYILEDEFNAKSGYSALVSGGGSTKTVTYGDNGKILKISNATVKVELLQGMNAEDKPHGYFKYINSRNANVAFEWYDRAGNQISNNVPSVCPADAVVEVFADYAKDEYVLNFGQSKVISAVSEEKVQQIVSKSFDSLLEPGEGTQPFSKHPLPNPQGYLSTYSSVMYDDEDRLVVPRNAYDRALFELFFEANKSTAYCTISIATVELLLGRILQPEDIELGIALEQSTAITPGLYSATTPSNVPSTWAWNGKFIPLTTEGGEHNDPNNPSVWLSQDGDYVYSESEAGNKPKYDQMSISDLMVKDGQTWRYALRRGYIMKDGTFVFDAESPYYAFVIKISGYQTPQSKIHTVFFNRGGISLYPDAISAYVSQEKIREQLDQLTEGLAQGFIYAKEVTIG